MSANMEASGDAVLQQVVSGDPRVPGVVAMATDRNGIIYEAALNTPLLFDPGEAWEYGSNIDWAGQVVEGIAGKRLGEVMQERILAPLGIRTRPSP